LFRLSVCSRGECQSVKFKKTKIFFACSSLIISIRLILNRLKNREPTEKKDATLLRKKKKIRVNSFSKNLKILKFFLLFSLLPFLLISIYIYYYYYYYLLLAYLHQFQQYSS